MTPGKLDTIKPTSSATYLTEGDCFARTVVAFVTNFVASSDVKATVKVTELKTKPIKVLSCLGSKTDFSWFKMKPRSVKSLVVTATLVLQSEKVPR